LHSYTLHTQNIQSLKQPEFFIFILLQHVSVTKNKFRLQRTTKQRGKPLHKDNETRSEEQGGTKDVLHNWMSGVGTPGGIVAKFNKNRVLEIL
jgi:hypothetical protein